MVEKFAQSPKSSDSPNDSGKPKLSSTEHRSRRSPERKDFDSDHAYKVAIGDYVWNRKHYGSGAGG